MALFKVFRGKRTDLDQVDKTDGHAYFCTDDGSFWIDYTDEEGQLKRKQVNEEDLKSKSSTINLENGAEIGTIEIKDIKQESYTTPGGIASGIGAIALTGQRGDKDPSTLNPTDDRISEARGLQSFVQGPGNLAAGDWSFVTGKDNIVYGNRAFVSGGANRIQQIDTNGNPIENKTNTGRFNAIFGNNNTFTSMEEGTTTESNLIAGGSNTVSGQKNSVAGYSNNVTGSYNNVSGHGNTLKNGAARNIVGGFNNTVEGGSSLVAGEANTNSGNWNLVVGSHCAVKGNHNVVEGESSINGADYGHAEGYSKIGSGANYAHTQNYNTEANASYSSAAGVGTKANYSSQFVVGQYNQSKDYSVFEIGGGTSDTDRKNLLEVDKNTGRLYNYLTEKGKTSKWHGDILVRSEVEDLVDDKLDKTGGSINGNLTVSGSLTTNDHFTNDLYIFSNKILGADASIIYSGATHQTFTLPDQGGIVATEKYVEEFTNLSKGEGEFSIQQESYVNCEPKATGLGAVAFGGFRGDKRGEEPTEDDRTNVASGIQSFVAGCGNLAAGDWSFVSGKDNTVYANRAFVSGGANRIQQVDADGNLIEDKTNVGRFNAVFGNNNTCTSTNTESQSNLVAGGSNTVDGQRNIVGGYSNNLVGSFDLISGGENNVTTSYSIVGGKLNTVEGSGHLVSGIENEVSNQTNVVGGIYNNNKGWHCLSVGKGLTIKDGQTAKTVIGQYNEDKPNTIFEIGWGDDGSPNNIFEVYKDGVVKTNQGTLATQEYTNELVNAPKSKLSIGTDNSTEEAVNSIAFGKHSLNRGHQSAAIGWDAYVGYNKDGTKTTNTPTCAIALNWSRANANYSLSAGYDTEVSNDNSVALNRGTKTGAWNQTVLGSYNIGKTDTALEVGNGNSSTNRLNAFEVLKVGGFNAYGNSTIDGTLSVKALLIDGKEITSEGSSLDVQVNGESIVKDGVANLTAATTTKYGVVKLGAGLATGNTGGTTIATIQCAPDSAIDAKSSKYHPIVPSNLDYAVKVAVTTNTKILTEDEKTAACNWLGAKRELDEQSLFDRRIGIYNNETVELSDYYGTVPLSTFKEIIFLCSVNNNDGTVNKELYAVVPLKKVTYHGVYNIEIPHIGTITITGYTTTTPVITFTNTTGYTINRLDIYNY